MTKCMTICTSGGDGVREAREVWAVEAIGERCWATCVRLRVVGALAFEVERDSLWLAFRRCEEIRILSCVCTRLIYDLRVGHRALPVIIVIGSDIACSGVIQRYRARSR